MKCDDFEAERMFDDPVTRLVGMRTAAIGLIVALSACGFASNAFAGNDRSPTAAEVRALAAEVWRYPPSVFDITVITTTNRTPWSEADVRRSVEQTFAEQKADNPRFDSSSEKIEAEVKRMMDLERVPFVRKERWRNRDLDFCVDLAEKREASEVIDAATPFDESLFFLKASLDAPVVSGRRDFGSKTLAIDAPENAWEIERSNLWEGGAFSFRCVLLLKTLFGWPAITESDPGLDEARIAAITSGGAGGVKLRVIEAGSKKTFVVSGWDAVATFTCQGDSILPIMEEVVTNAFGQVVSRMTVTELNAAGEPVEFEMLGPPKRMNEPVIPVKVRVLARQIGGELPADTFSLDRPEGWSKWDGRTRELIFFDGTPREVPPRRAAPTVANPSSVKRILFLTNAAILVALAASWGWRYLRGRSAPVSKAGKPTRTERSE